MLKVVLDHCFDEIIVLLLEVVIVFMVDGWADRSRVRVPSEWAGLKSPAPVRPVNGFKLNKSIKESLYPEEPGSTQPYPLGVLSNYFPKPK